MSRCQRAAGLRQVLQRGCRPGERRAQARKPAALRHLGAAPAALARALLAFGRPRLAFAVAWLVTGCLPPDFVIEPAENRPVTIDKSLLTVSPDQYQDLSDDCQPVVFDVTNAIKDEDKDDPVTIAWLVNYPPNQHVEPDANNRLRFTYDPCRNPKSVVGKVSTIEVFVLDRTVPLDILADADELKAFDGDNVTTDSVVWFVGIDSDACCP